MYHQQKKGGRGVIRTTAPIGGLLTSRKKETKRKRRKSEKE